MQPQLILIAAQQRVADLRRAADRHRLVRSATTATSSRAVPAPPHAAGGPIPSLRWLRRLEPRRDQVGDCM
jgi:hypothetical protein